VSQGPRVTQDLRLRELTAGGRGAIRVLALEGEGVCARLAPLLGDRVVPAGTFARVALREADGSLLDEAILLVESDRRLELHLHGSPALVERVRSTLGCSQSPEPSASLEERAERRLEAAASEPAARLLLAQAEGALRAEYERLRASSDDELVRGARALAERGRLAHWHLEPPRVVLAGPVNAGKSTLFNLLVGRERAVVSPAPGTTRDVVHARVKLGTLAVDLFDTAGIRALDRAAPELQVEQAGQELAREWCASADLVLWLAPAPATPPPPLGERLRLVHTLDDRDPERERRAFPSLSVLRAPEEARRIVTGVVHSALAVPREPFAPGTPVPFEKEQTDALANAEPVVLRSRLAQWLTR